MRDNTVHMTVHRISASPIAQTMRAALIFAVSIAVVNGFGRFAYALLLPVMRQELQWDYALSGWLNTANSLGYGAGALAGLFLLSRYRPALLFVAGLLLTVLTLLLCGFTQNIWAMMLWRFISGVGSAWVFACGGALIATHYAQDKSAAAIAIYYAGGGLGICLSGLLLFPVLSAASGAPGFALSWLASWQSGWLLLGLCGLLLSILPAKLALTVGGKTASVAQEAFVVRPLLPILVAYFLFGAGYIVYLTFVVAWMREMQLAVPSSISVWMVMGLASIASGYVWRSIMTRWWPANTFAAATLCTAIGTAIPIVNHSLPALWLSALFVGGSFFMVPGAMMALARVTLPASQWAKVMNLFTLIFAIGQAAGPVIAGWIADAKSLNLAMACGAATLLAASGIALLQKKNLTVK
jgi:predicted MFS family arabinose efflux permease